jgi:hypothetical protein
LDKGFPAAGQVMLLGEMFFQHAAAEIRIIPGDFVLSLPQVFRWEVYIQEVCKPFIKHKYHLCRKKSGLFSRANQAAWLKWAHLFPKV